MSTSLRTKIALSYEGNLKGPVNEGYDSLSRDTTRIDQWSTCAMSIYRELTPVNFRTDDERRYAYIRDASIRAQPSAPSKLRHVFLTDRRINAAIAIGSGMFVLGLIISAVFAPEWRALHVFQALIYVVMVAMARRKSAGGFGAGLAVAVFWNALGVFVTSFARDAIRELGTLTRTGQTQHPDVLLSLFAFCGHLLIIIGCVVGFIRIKPSARQWGQLLAGGLISVSYLIAIVFVFGPPQAVKLMKHVLGI